MLAYSELRRALISMVLVMLCLSLVALHPMTLPSFSSAALRLGELQNCPSSGPTVYQNDFEGTVGAEWSLTLTDSTPTGRHFLGQFGNDDVTLSLACLPEHTQVTVTFDLYMIRSWDGNQVHNPISGGLVGPDVWGLRAVGRPALLQTTFTNWPDFRQAYPDAFPGGDQAARTRAVEGNTLGYVYASMSLDSVYRLRLAFPHTGESLALTFWAQGLQALTDESWGLDNVEVQVAPPYLLYLPMVAGGARPAVTPTATSSATATLTATQVPLSTPTTTRTATSLPTETPTITQTQTNTPSVTAPATSTPTSILTATSTPTPSPVVSTATPTPTETATHTPTVTPTGTVTRTGTMTPTRTGTVTPTSTITITGTPTTTRTATMTLTPTPTITNTPVTTLSPTATIQCPWPHSDPNAQQYCSGGGLLPSVTPPP